MNGIEEKRIMLDDAVEKGVKLTPMMSQYYNIKKEYKDMLLFYRMGDFYELFFEDAIEASKILNITLTKRGKVAELEIPMAGIPHHAAPNYIDRLTGIGKKVAIAEQVEDPKLAKGIVKRQVTQVATPGIPYDYDKLNENSVNFIGSCFYQNNKYGLALIDYTTGDFLGFSFDDEESLLKRIELISLKEFLIFHDQFSNKHIIHSLLSRKKTLVTFLPKETFDPSYNEIYIDQLIPQYKKDKTLSQESHLFPSLSALAYYVCTTQSNDEIAHLKPFKLESLHHVMNISYDTLTGLEILPKAQGDYQNSLLGFLDHTKSAVGKRFLRRAFTQPLTNQTHIEQRQDQIETLIDKISSIEEIRSQIDELRDIERILAKLTTNKISASDMLNLANSVELYNSINKTLKNDSLTLDLPKIFKVSKLKDLSKDIKMALSDEIGASLDKGNLIKDGFSTKRDKLHKTLSKSTDNILKLEENFRKSTGIPTLKIKFNNVAGYFIEVSKSHIGKLPKTFSRRQTLVNCERYSHEELTVFEEQLMKAKAKLYKVEAEIFEDLKLEIKSNVTPLQELSFWFGTLDFLQCLSWSAYQNNYSRPEISSEQCVQISNGHHPLIKKSLKDQFVEHSIDLRSDCYFGLITGPNMSGKTTVMREVAIIQFLMQIGSFVPAKKAKLSITDFIFSRLGASDDITRGQSTFMVEMSETSEILRHATSKSLILLDEIGRGTSTYDGLSIAWSLVEYFILKVKATTLFSTHYHELIELVDSFTHAKNLTVRTLDVNGDIKFLYELIEQGAAQSFGINVAKLAGLPSEVVYRASEVLKGLEEKDSHQSNNQKKTNQLEMFDLPKDSVFEEKYNKLKKSVDQIDVMNQAPLKTLAQVQKLQENQTQQ